MFTIFTWIVTLICVIGVIINAQKKIQGFYWWMVGNACWIIINLYNGVWAAAALFTFYFCMCFYGLYMWKKDERGEDVNG